MFLTDPQWLLLQPLFTCSTSRARSGSLHLLHAKFFYKKELNAIVFFFETMFTYFVPLVGATGGRPGTPKH